MVLGANGEQVRRAMGIVGAIMNDEQLDSFAMFVEECQLNRIRRKLEK